MRCHLLDPVVSISSRTQIKTPGFGAQGSWVQIPAPHLLVRSWASSFTSLWVSAPLTGLWEDSMWLYTWNTEHRAWGYITNAQETVLWWWARHGGGLHAYSLSEGTELQKRDSEMASDLLNFTELVKAQWEPEPRCLAMRASFKQMPVECLWTRACHTS